MTKIKMFKWEDFSINSPAFIKAKQKESLSQILHHYFSQNKRANNQFIIDLALNYPEHLLRAIRVNRAFLIPEHQDSLEILKEHSNQRLANHYRFFSKLSIIEKDLFTQFEKALNKCMEREILDVLIWISFWFEEKRASLFETQSTNTNNYDIDQFIETINFFLSHYLFASKEKIKNTIFYKEQDLEAVMHAMLEAKAIKDIRTHSVWHAIDTAHLYYQFLKSTIEIYSFDLNYDVTIEDNIATLKYLDENKLKRWFLESIKQLKWYEYYRTLATELVHHQMSVDHNFIKDKTGIDYEMNYEGTIRNTIARIVADEFSIIQSKLSNVPTVSLLQILSGFVNNAYGRYVAPMDKLNYEKPSKWLENIGINTLLHGKIKKDQKDNRLAAFPSRFSDKQVILDIIHSNIKKSEPYSDDLVKLLSFDISNFHYVDRLRPIVNIYGKPFIKLNDFYFAFNGILGETNSQINTLINVMDSNAKDHSWVTKSEVEEMEKHVHKLFLNAGFQNTDSAREYFINQNIGGDFDILVYENGVLLLIELKRSKIRIHLSDAHDEYENSLLKASSQLTKAQEYIATNFQKCKTEYFNRLNIKETDFSQIKFYPIIVSTSFEHDHTAINDKHFKISLFELQNVLENDIESLGGNKLEGLIMKLLRNEYWQAFEIEFEQPDFNKYVLQIPL